MSLNVLDIFSKPTAQWFAQTLGEPTKVQKSAWPAIMEGKSVLVSAPTGTGKTLSAFLTFIDQLARQANEKTLREGVQLIYISPLKSLAADIRENLRRPLEGMKDAGKAIRVAVRTGDTLQKDRQKMVKHPPHILITTPESLFLMLTSASGQKVLKTARAVVIDELHALIDTKRGAHLLFSIARLERLCGKNLQRIGLSATIEPLDLAASWLSPDPVEIVAPVMQKKIEISVVGNTPASGLKKDPVWEELARKVYERCLKNRSVIAFSEARRYAEKLAYYVNQIGGEDFARVHHGSLSKEQRFLVEEALREGRLRLLCATSSMELGIDVGEIDEVIQIGCPRTVSSAMQRLGRAGHNPGRTSVMYMYPRTAPEGLSCGMTAALALQGNVESARPPKMCLDVLAQHLVSMAATAAGAESVKEEAEHVYNENVTVHRASAAVAYTVDEVLLLTKRAWSFYGVDKNTVKKLLSMLAGDYEHNREIPVRPRIIYDRIHELVYSDSYSRMLAVAAGGTIPDKGLYAAKTPDGVKVGELDEEFVFESHVGDRFLLGSFGWRMIGQDKDTVFVEPASADSARIPFWHGDLKGRSLNTSIAFGKMLSQLDQLAKKDGGIEEREEYYENTSGLISRKAELCKKLASMGLDQAATENAAGYLCRQIAVTGCLPDDKTIIAEHFCDGNGSHQVMIHALFGRRINAPLAILARHVVQEKYHINVGCVDEEDGILLYPYGEEILPEGILQSISADIVTEVLEAVLPQTPLFHMTFRYNAARALMMGMKRNGRQPLWMQRLRSTEMLERLIHEKGHPLMEETRRECLEDLWDIDGLMWLLSGIRSGGIRVHEIWVDTPSPMSLPLQWQAEAAEMYEYSPSTQGIRQAVYDELKAIDGLKPSAEVLAQQEARKLPENAMQLHSLLMMEGDLIAGELPVLGEWLEELACRGQAVYCEPGLWIAAEQQEEYEKGLHWMGTESDENFHSAGAEGEALEKRACLEGKEAASHILRRMLYYRGCADLLQICQRYAACEDNVLTVLEELMSAAAVVESEGVYFHEKRYRQAQRATIKQLRTAVVTQPVSHYAALMAQRVRIAASPAAQVKACIEQFCQTPYPADMWEGVLLPARVKGYREALLDSLLAEGDFFWQLQSDGNLRFEKSEDVDWDGLKESETEVVSELDDAEKILYEQLQKRGAAFARQLSRALENAAVHTPMDVQMSLLGLAEKGLVCADSFVPVRQWLNREKLAKTTARQRVNARVQAMSAGRWDLVRPLSKKTKEQWLERQFFRQLILCKETFQKPEPGYFGQETETDQDTGVQKTMTWSDALEILRVWEYVGKVRRGYFVKGMSGAQFIRNEDFAYVTQALAAPQQDAIWLHATDPACIWGKALNHETNRDFVTIPATAVCLKAGKVAALLERKGKLLRIFEKDCMEEGLAELVNAFRERRLFPGQKRLVVKEYPAWAGELLKSAGFIKEMQDYVLYLS
ncbi:MAG: DEAD/DEAH box helicase [Lachnospiraceae bacterium]|nr:DEAD/DEAH box helicase [Lachnospiraceae bacterium]